MKSGKSIFNFIITLSLVLTQVSCSNDESIPNTPNEFIQHFLDQNSERVYKSEIQRVKVDIFPASGLLVHSFWKRKKYNANGKLFLHLYPKNKNDLAASRKRHGFVNVPVDTNDIMEVTRPYFYQIHSLQIPYDFSKIQSGQFNDTSKTWKSDVRKEQLLKKVLPGRKELLEAKNTDYEARMIKDNGVSTILGPMLYVSTDAIKIFYNATLNRLTIQCNEENVVQSDERALFVEAYYDNVGPIIKTINLNDFDFKDGIGIYKHDLPLAQGFTKLVIGQHNKENKTTWRAFESERLIHSSFALNKENLLIQDLAVNDLEVEIIEKLLVGTLPLVYYNFDLGLGIFLNIEKKMAYIMCNNLVDFENLNLRSTVVQKGESRDIDVNLMNSFQFIGEKRQMVIHELNFSESLEAIDWKINSNGKEIYQRLLN